MTIRFQYLQDKKTGEIITAGYIDLESQLSPDTQIVFGRPPEGSKYKIEQTEQQVLPQGKNLIDFIISSLSQDLSDDKIIALIAKLNIFITFFNLPKCNPLAIDTLNGRIESFSANYATYGLSEEEYTAISSLLTSWKEANYSGL